MKKKILQYFLRTLLPSFAIVASFFLTFNVLGCGSTLSGLSMLSGDFSVPKITSFELKEADLVQLSFTKNVEVSNLSLTLLLENENQEVPCDFSFEEEKLLLHLQNQMTPGSSYQLDGCVMDENKNILSFSIPFKGFNGRVPSLLISEVRNAYGSKSINKVKHYKTEFVELFILEDGNLSGVKIISANDGEEKSYTCPNLEVKAGSYVTVHMRTIPQDKITDEILISEINGDLTASYSLDTSSYAVDLWSENSSAVFAQSDVIAVIDSQTGLPLDALCYETYEKKLDTFSEIAELVLQNENWLGDPFDASLVTSSAVTRSIARQNLSSLYADFKNGLYEEKIISSQASDFLLVSEVTPGYENSSSIFTKSKSRKK